MNVCLVAGHLCIDLVPRLTRLPSVVAGGLAEIGPLELRPGGCVANTGGDLGALGASVRLAANVGNDELGHLLRSTLAATPTDARGIRSVATATSYSLVIEAPGQDRTFWHHVGANEDFDGVGVDFADVSLVHLGYPSLLPRLCRESAEPLRSWLEDARRRGCVTSLDLATVDASSDREGRWGDVFRKVLPAVDVIAPSLDDLRSAIGLPGEDDADSLRDAAETLIGLGAAVVLIKLGADGLYLRTATSSRLRAAGRLLARLADTWSSRELWTPAVEVKVRGTTGAGDAAVAGLLFAIVHGLSPAVAIRGACLSAAWRVERRGPLPRWQELFDQLDQAPLRPARAFGDWPLEGGVARGPSDVQWRASNGRDQGMN